MAKRIPVSFSVVNLGQKRLRAACGALILKQCGKNVNIEKGAAFDSSVCQGENSGLGINCLIGAGTTIGNNVMMGPNVKIYTQNQATDRTDIPMCEQGIALMKSVMIGNGVYAA